MSEWEDPREVERRVTEKVKSNPGLAKQLPTDVVMEYAYARQALQIAFLKQNPMAPMGGPPDELNSEQEQAARRVEAALAKLEEAVDAVLQQS